MDVLVNSIENITKHVLILIFQYYVWKKNRYNCDFFMEILMLVSTNHFLQMNQGIMLPIAKTSFQLCSLSCR